HGARPGRARPALRASRARIADTRRGRLSKGAGRPSSVAFCGACEVRATACKHRAAVDSQCLLRVTGLGLRHKFPARITGAEGSGVDWPAPPLNTSEPSLED